MVLVDVVRHGTQITRPSVEPPPGGALFILLLVGKLVKKRWLVPFQCG